jgi:hypothetical protein
MRVICITTIFLFIGNCGSECKAQERSFEEIVRSHSQINEAIVSAGGFSISSTVNRLNEPVTFSRMLVDYKLGSVVLENRESLESSYFVNTVYSINPRYAFKLTSKGKAEWELFKYVISDSPDLNLKNVGLGVEYTRPLNMLDNVAIFPSVRALGESRISLPNLAKFREMSDPRVSQLNASQIELVFERTIAGGYDPDGLKALAGKKSKCRFVLNSSPPYLPINFSETCGQELTLNSTIEYEEPTYYSGKIVERVTEFWENKKMDLVVKTDLAIGAPPKREFLLSNYGFNEPSELNKPLNSAWIIFLVAGLLLIGAAVFLRSFRARKSRA